MAKARMIEAPAPPDDRPIEEIWVEYKRTYSEELRNRLMENYLPLVKYNAERIHAKLPEEVDIDDLMSAGIFGLMDTIDAFDMERGIKFETYCARVSGERSSTSCARWTGCRVWCAPAPARLKGHARAWRWRWAARPPTMNCLRR